MLIMTITLAEKRHNIIKTIRNAMDSLNHLEGLSRAEADRIIDATYNAMGVLAQNAYDAGILEFNDLKNMNICEGVLPTMWA